VAPPRSKAKPAYAHSFSRGMPWIKKRNETRQFCNAKEREEILGIAKPLDIFDESLNTKQIAARAEYHEQAYQAGRTPIQSVSGLITHSVRSTPSNGLRLSGRRPPRPGHDELVARRSAPTAG